MVLLANPNNPTSTALRTAALTRLVEALPATVLLVVDEAYREYVTDPDVPDALDHFGGRANVVVLRTFSKAWALAGLRVGYLVGDPSVAHAVDATLTPFSVSTPAQAAALAALEQHEEVARRAAVVVAERDAGQRRAGRPGAARSRQPGELRVAADRPGERRAGRRPWSAGASSPGPSRAASG